MTPARADEGSRGIGRPAPLPTRGTPVGELPDSGPGDTQQFERPVFDSGAFDGPSQSGAPQPGGGARAQGYPADQSGEYARPSWAQPSPPGDGPRSHEEPEPVRGSTGSYSAPEGLEPLRSQAPAEADYGIPAVPPAGDDVPTPIFSSMESNWFNGRRAQGRPVQHAPAPTPAPGPSSGFPGGALPRREPAGAPQAHAGPAAVRGEETAGGWGASPNDERWRRAEQVRKPAAGGVTTSGLPRRVPRANLVAGTAQQQSTAPAGPQVSRAPADVRGRLTNLRRGIQQGRQAGNGPADSGHGVGPTYQQER